MADNVEPSKTENIHDMKRLQVLEELARLGVPATPTEVNKTLRFPKQTLHRTFSQLADEGYIELEFDGRSYSMGPKLRDLAIGVISSTHLRSARLVIMTSLSKKVGETCNIAIPQKNGMVYLDRVETSWPIRVHMPVGTSVPFHCTASGKLYLASLEPKMLNGVLRSHDYEAMTERTKVSEATLREEIDVIAKQGYAEDQEEFIDGMNAIAVPVEDKSGRFLCCLSIHAPSQRMSLEKARTHLDALWLAAEKLSGFVGLEK